MRCKPPDAARYERMIGKTVVKLSGKPFKSHQQHATVSGIVVNPYTDRPAFVFADCEGYVECRACTVLVDDPVQYFAQFAEKLESGMAPKDVQRLVSRHAQRVKEQPATPERDDALAALARFEGDMIKLIEGTAV